MRANRGEFVEKQHTRVLELELQSRALGAVQRVQRFSLFFVSAFDRKQRVDRLSIVAHVTCTAAQGSRAVELHIASCQLLAHFPIRKGFARAWEPARAREREQRKVK